jgi:hypothetical protein
MFRRLTAESSSLPLRRVAKHALRRVPADAGVGGVGRTPVSRLVSREGLTISVRVLIWSLGNCLGESLDGPTLASMAVASGSVFLRTATHLYRIGASQIQ